MMSTMRQIWTNGEESNDDEESMACQQQEQALTNMECLSNDTPRMTMTNLVDADKEHEHGHNSNGWIGSERCTNHPEIEDG